PLVEELLEEFDQPPVPSTTKIVVLSKGKAAEIVPAVQQMMSEGGSPQSSYRSTGRRSWGGGWPWGGFGASSTNAGSDSDLQMTAIESSNLVMLKGPLDKVIRAEEMIKQLDEQATGDGPII